MSNPVARWMKAAQAVVLHLMAGSLVFALVCLCVTSALYLAGVAVGLLLDIRQLSERTLGICLYGGFFASFPPALLAAFKAYGIASRHGLPWEW